MKTRLTVLMALIGGLMQCRSCVLVSPCASDCKFFEVCDAVTESCRPRQCTASSDCGQGHTLVCVSPDGGDGHSVCQPNQCATNSDCSDLLGCNGEEVCIFEPSTGVGSCAQATLKPCSSSTQVCKEHGSYVECETNPRCDVDGDGELSIACGGGDCDDQNASVSPRETEVCDVNGVDEDCDPTTFGNRDGDADGYFSSSCCNGSGATLRCGTDCNDSDPRVHPEQPEVCNGLDDNCDNAVDDTVLVIAYRDADRDGYGARDAGSFSVCADAPGYSTLANDCDDQNAGVTPGAFICGTGANQVRICGSDGLYIDSKCASGLYCYTQPNGTGICR